LASESWKLIAKLRATLEKRNLPCFAALIMIALTLVACIILAQPPQFIIGATSASWRIDPSDVDQVRYLPGTGTPTGSQQPSAPTDASPNTFAFKVITGVFRVSTTSIKLTSAVDNTRFSKFQITVQRWDSTASAWKDETLYTDISSTVKPYINGLENPLDIGYTHQAALTSGYYLIKLTCLGDTATPVTIIFQYTLYSQPSPYFLLGIVAPALIISFWLLYPASRHKNNEELNPLLNAIAH